MLASWWQMHTPPVSIRAVGAEDLGAPEKTRFGFVNAQRRARLAASEAESAAAGLGAAGTPTTATTSPKDADLGR